VWFLTGEEAVLKATWPDFFGLLVIHRPSEEPRASPVDYLQRWAFHNDLFGDAITFVGALATDAGLRLLIRQPAVAGEPATDEQIAEFFTSTGWKRFSIDGDVAFFDPDRCIAISDTHRGNIILMDDGLLAVGGPSGRIAVYDTRDWCLLWDDSHEAFVSSMSFSPDGRLLLSTTNDLTAAVRDARSGDLVSLYQRHLDKVIHGAFSPDGRWIVTGSYDGTAHVWESLTGKPLLAPLRHRNQVVFFVIDADGRRVASASREGAVHVWEADTGALASPPHDRKRVAPERPFPRGPQADPSRPSAPTRPSA